MISPLKEKKSATRRYEKVPLATITSSVSPIGGQYA